MLRWLTFPFFVASMIGFMIFYVIVVAIGLKLGHFRWVDRDPYNDAGHV